MRMMDASGTSSRISCRSEMLRQNRAENQRQPVISGLQVLLLLPQQQQRQQRQLVQRRLSSSIIVLLLYFSLLIAFVSTTRQLPTAHAFAYAPNFITKIIESDTGVTPVGLLEVGSSSGGVSTTLANNGQQQPQQILNEEVDTVDNADAAVNGNHGATTVSTTNNNNNNNNNSTQRQHQQRRSIITRFPPEPNGYLHLGHAKAVSFNFAVARAYKGRCHMRLDDTNPTKEDEEYVRSILEDVTWIQQGMEPFVVDNNYDAHKVIAADDDGNGGGGDNKEETANMGPWYGKVRKTSDYFHLMYDAAVYLIRSGEAYIDELTMEEMREYRGTLTEAGTQSPYRNRPIHENLQLFQQMRDGVYPDGKYVLRAKIDMSSPNLNLRDPVLYRIKHESHQATGDEWCIYPMYDFSHPIADAVEGISHSLCTLEFEDHRPLYDWVAERILRAGFVDYTPRQIEFSRLNLKYTVLSKRKLIKLVEESHVTGWDDPRMPTISGIRRRGVPPSAIRLFCERMGISKSDSNIDFGVLEDCAREVLDENCPRAFAILDPLKVTIKNWGGSLIEEFEVPRHPKRSDLGDRTVPFGKSVYIERSDFFDLDGPEGEVNNNKVPSGFKRLLAGEKVRLKYAYVIRCDEVVRNVTTNEPVELLCTVFPETRSGATPEGEARVKGIIQWVETTSAAKCQVMQYDRLFNVEEPGKWSGDFITDINKDSLKVLTDVVLEPTVALDALKVIAQIRSNPSQCDKIYHSVLAYQFERNGYYALDSSSTVSNLVFNRVVTLKDAWNALPTDGDGDKNDINPKVQPVEMGTKIGGGEKGQAPVIEDARRIALRAGTILEAGPHPDADGLIVCKLDCGDVDEYGQPLEPRTVVAGLAGKISFDELINRKVLCIANLKPAKMRGIESTAMLLAASDGKEGDEETVQLIDVPSSVPNGELLSFEGMPIGEPDVMLKSKGALKVWDRVKEKLRVNGNGEAVYQDEDNTTRKIMSSDGPAKVSSLRDCMIG